MREIKICQDLSTPRGNVVRYNRRLDGILTVHSPHLEKSSLNFLRFNFTTNFNLAVFSSSKATRTIISHNSIVS